MLEKIVCSHCGKEFIIRSYKKYYAYKLKEYCGDKMFYFCTYTCMQAEKREHPEKYRSRVKW